MELEEGTGGGIELEASCTSGGRTEFSSSGGQARSLGSVAKKSATEGVLGSRGVVLGLPDTTLSSPEYFSQNFSNCL